jgi:hypothetical protein
MNGTDLQKVKNIIAFARNLVLEKFDYDMSDDDMFMTELTFALGIDYADTKKLPSEAEVAKMMEGSDDDEDKERDLALNDLFMNTYNVLEAAWQMAG